MCGTAHSIAQSEAPAENLHFSMEDREMYATSEEQRSGKVR